jgi:outer membrane immunogenic protein
MKKLTLIAALASVALATPALAGEGRFEGRAGLAFGNGNSDFLAGIGAGYDFDLGEMAFAGPEVSLDTNFDGTELINLGGRVGAKLNDAGKLYVAAGYEVNDSNSFNLGAGYQHAFGENTIGKVEYRRFFQDGSDANTVMVSVGFRF